MGVCTAKGCRGRPQTSPVFIALWSPPQRRNPYASGKAIYNRKEQLLGRAHLARQYASCGQSSLGARLRTRKVTGRDASLPAPLLAASLGLVGRGTVGALPQAPQGTLSLDPARGNFPLDPFRAIELVTLPYFFRVFILLFTLYFNLSANDVALNRSGSPSHSAHVAPISA